MNLPCFLMMPDHGQAEGCALPFVVKKVEDVFPFSWLPEPVETETRTPPGFTSTSFSPRPRSPAPSLFDHDLPPVGMASGLMQIKVIACCTRPACRPHLSFPGPESG
jgi:hypothetical protein